MLTKNHNGRLACHYCGPCERGCVTNSYFSSPFTTVADALKSGNCTLITNAVVSHVDMDPSANKAAGVTYVDRISHKTYQVRGRAIILCAQALESTRILLNSKNQQYPAGLANSSGALGRYLTAQGDQVGGLSIRATVPVDLRPAGTPLTLKVSLPVRPSEAAFSPLRNWSGSTPMPTRFDR